jgi:hypothetical protein
VKRTGRDEPVGVVVLVFLETIQGHSLSSYLYLKQAKTSYISFYLFCFFLLQNRRRAEQVLWSRGKESGTSGRREVVGKVIGG